ncbi:BnaA01g36690D, partial [Brassica napus]
VWDLLISLLRFTSRKWLQQR